MLIKRYLLALSCALGVVLLDFPVQADSWPAFRGPQGAGRSTESLPPGDGPLAFALVWRQPLGSGYSGISIAGSMLVTAMADGERDYLVALDRETGAELWRHDLAATYLGHDGSHDGPVSTPAIAGGRVFMLAPLGRLVALDAADGELLWSRHLADDLGCPAPYYGFASSPVVVGDVLALQVGCEEGFVAGFDVASGEVLWRALEESGGAGSTSPIAAELAGRQQVLVLGSQQLSGLDAEDGSVLWQLDFEGQGSAMGAYSQSPVPIGNDRILVKQAADTVAIVEVVREGEALVARQVGDSRGLARSYSPPSLAGDHVYGFTARFLSAIEPATGELLWRSREPGDGFLLSVDGQLAVLAKTGSLHLGAASTDGWQQTMQLELFDDLAWTPPSFAGGALYARSLGQIARVDLVRQSAPGTAAAGSDRLPPVLAPLAAELETAEDRRAVVERFVGDRELPLIDGESVVFLWHGEAEDVAIGGDMIGMRREEPMHRLAGTDLWWWATELDRRARISYLFFVDYQPVADPSHRRTVDSTVLGPDMNWQRGESLTMSWFAMPEWPGRGAEPSAAVALAGGRLETLELALQPKTPEGEDEAPETVPLSVHVWLPPGYGEGTTRYPVVYVHNGSAREAGSWPETLERVVGQTVEPLIAVLLDPPRIGGFSDLFAEQVVPEIDRRYRTLRERGGRANVGMGWSGFGASLTTFSHPQLFGAFGVQSLYALEGQMSALEAAIGEADAATLPLDIYLEWGRWDLVSPHEEMNMRESSAWAWQLFNGKGWAPSGGEVWDSTDFASWRNRTDTLLEALFPLDGAAGVTLARWQTGGS